MPRPLDAPDAHAAPAARDGRRATLELAVLASLAFGLEWVLAGRDGGHGLHPHPYWLFVLPLAALRGAGPGLLAATVAAVFYLGRHPALDGNASLSLDALREPLLFFLVGGGVGLAQEGLRRTVRELRGLLEETEAALAHLRTERQRSEGSTAADATAAGRRDWQVGPGDHPLFQRAVELVAERCGAPACALAVREDGSVELAACSRGEDDGERFAAIGTSKLALRARRQGVGLVAEPGSTDPVAAAAPLFDDSGFLRGLLCLEAGAPVDETVARTFLGVAEWASAAFARVRRGGEMLDARVAGQLVAFPRRWLGTPDDLDERLHTEFERFVRHDVPMSALAVLATRWTDTSAAARAELDRFVLDTVGAGLRVTDTLYHFDWPGCYVLVLMGTSASASEGLLTRLQSKLAEARDDAFGPLEFHVAAPGLETPDCNDLIERIADWFRATSPLSLGSRPQVLSGGPRRVGDWDACLARIELELHAGLRTDSEVSIVELDVEHPDAVAPDTLAREFQPVLQRSLRRSDGAYSLGPNRLLLVLPHTGPEEAELVAERLRERLEGVDAGFGLVRASGHTLASGASPQDVLEGLARDASPRAVA